MLPFPLDSVLTTRTRPISAVLWTWVPPSACLSSPTMSTTRTSGTLSGTRLTLVRISASSSTASLRARNEPIEGEGRLVAVSDTGESSAYKRGERVFHQKFGYGKVTAIEGNKLTVAFEKAGEKKVIDSFVERA